LKKFFGKAFFVAFLKRNVSFTVVVNGRDRSVGENVMFSSISGSESTDVEISNQNIKPDLNKWSTRKCMFPVEPKNSQGDLNLTMKPRTYR
jgi:hypothetical protein